MVLGIVGVVLALNQPSAEAADPWWDANWPYRAPVDISSAGYENDQEILCRIDNQDNLSNHLGSDNFNDLRFVTTDGSTELNYFIELKSNGDWADVWIQMPDDNTLDNFYCYYGYAAALARSSAENTFMLFENFFTTGSANFPEVRQTSDVSSDGSNLVLAQGGAGVRSAMLIRDDIEMSWRWKYDDTAQMDCGFRDDAGTWQHQMEGAGEDGAIAFTDAAGSSFFEVTDGSGSSEQRNYGAGYVPAATWIYDNLVFDAKNYVQHTHLATGGSEVSYKAVSNIPNTTANMEVELFCYGGLAGDAYIDWVRVRNWENLDDRQHTLKVGTEEVSTLTYGNIKFVSVATLGKSVADRASDGYGSGYDDDVRFDIRIYDNYGVDNIRGYVTLRDNHGGIVLDNFNLESLGYFTLDENTKRYVYNYNPPDATTDENCGGWSIEVIAHSLGSGLENSYTENSMFVVDDLYFDNVGVENLAGHRTHVYGEVGRVSGIPVVTGDGYIIVSDNNLTPYKSDLVADNLFENTYTTPRFGQFYLEAFLDDSGIRLDGVMNPATENVFYEYPDLPISLVSVTVDNILIDNHASDNAITQTRITVIFEDNDNCEFDTFYIGIRDAVDALIDNDNVTTTYTCENSNRAIVYLDYDAEDNNLANNQMGNWDVWAYANDNVPATSEYAGWSTDVFIVNDLVPPITFTPNNPLPGWDVTVSGTTTRRFGAASVDNHRVVDAEMGTFWTGSGNSYSENYLTTGLLPSQTVLVTVTAWDDVLDGEASASYTTSDNQRFQFSIRFEENFELVDWIPDENRPITIELGWSGGSYEYTLTSNPENIEFDAGGSFADLITVTDNEDYLRRVVPTIYGGNVDMIIVGDTGTIDGTSTGDIAEFSFYLEDMTGQYIPPEGIMSLRLWIDENLAIISQDYWNADWRMVAWLVTGTRYQVWVQGEDAPLRLIGPIDAVNASEEKTIVVQSLDIELTHIYDDVYWTAWRHSDNVIRAEYQDNLSATTTAIIRIYNMAGTLLQTYQPDNEWFVVSYSDADSSLSYLVDLEIVHENYGEFSVNLPVGTLTSPPGPEGIGNPFGLPSGLTLAGIGSIIAMTCVALAFDATRIQLGVLSMACTIALFWYLGLLQLPGPFDGAFTATLFLVIAVIFALTWRRGKS
jgi:hypothetical protein